MRYQSIHLIAVSYLFNNKGWVFQVGEAGWGKGQVMSDVYFILSYYIYSFINGLPCLFPYTFIFPVHSILFVTFTFVYFSLFQRYN